MGWSEADAAESTVEKAWAGSGTVVTDSIDCGDICEHTYPAGSGVVLKVLPDTGSAFAGLQINGQPSKCLVIVDGQATVTATFE